MSNVGSTPGWYMNAYSGPFRTSRLRAPFLLPNRSIAPLVQQTLVVDAAHNANNSSNGNSQDKKKEKGAVRRRETVFGPDVGEDDEPGWVEGGKEEIGVEIVKQWTQKSKADEGLHPTTTLQALVNLKRPTLLLQQIESSAIPSPTTTNKPDQSDEITVVEHSDQQICNPASSEFHPDWLPTLPLHTLKFTYDATAPSVVIRLHLFPTPCPIISGKESIMSEHDHEPKVIYQGVHEGGFGKVFELPKEHGIDLNEAIQVPKEEQNDNNKEQQPHQVQNTEGPSGLNTVESQDTQITQAQTEPLRRRFNLFRRNRAGSEESAAQIEMTNQTHVQGDDGNGDDDSQNGNKEVKEIEQGMRLLIQIDAAGPEGEPLKRRNAQLTHILVTGTWISDSHAISPQPSGRRVWVIKVARREAVIGTHTFLLKEIYGLSQASTSSQSYPPTQDDPYTSTLNECIVCLTSPRDVVLLPCRHLVVCRECAVGMVEFGAGGKVARREDTTVGGDTETNADVSNSDTAAGSNGTVPQVAGGTTTTGRERRKKKVKGWYCPVCRQPYTSLLRLALPESLESSRPASRAASVRTTRTTKSLAPTLPEGAERMLESLRPRDQHVESDDEGGGTGHKSKTLARPTFVDGEKVETEQVDQRGNCPTAKATT
ncbi:uncharacterized protein L203_103964 [Cryptococcus depauperatus CBS 7841]|uniref:RING-type domain-containing protein n=1 Tax=Cryptococcus depauperatus CBS 7841 TaxID=1295531 RepID=A0A1E3HSB3_9TREE|nr:hypothetical protein L203_06007 [Cryptococcus depauperatus CBS 7841]